MGRLINISELSKLLELIDPITKKPLNHTLRYWEKEFKEIKPKIINKRRYYSSSQIEVIKMIKFLLRNKGMTIEGAKNLINQNINKLDEPKTVSLKADYYKHLLKTRSKTIKDKLNKLKSYGKKNSS